MERFRFDRKGRVVADHRRLMPYIGSEDYKSGMLIFRPRHCSPARLAFRERNYFIRQAKLAARKVAA